MAEHGLQKLRESAENRLSGILPDSATRQSLEDTVHELRVHQIELEMQNDELRRMQEILEESRERYVDFYDFAPIGYITMASDGRMEEINLSGAGMLGEERNKLLHGNFAHFVAPEDRYLWEQHLKAVLQLDNKLSCELSLIGRNGKKINVQLDSLRLLKKGAAAVIRIAMSDITERVGVAEEVREQEEFFRLITENIQDFIAVLDLEGRRIYNSPSYTRLFKGVDEKKGTDSFSDVHPDDRDRVIQIFRNTVRTGNGMKIEYRFLLPDGSVRHMESQGALIRGRSGQPLRVVVISHDITERKKSDEEIRKLAYFDSLTQLPNRRLLDDRMSRAMAASKRKGYYCALLFIDLDNFKPLNDLYGHGVGDTLLIEVAHRISSCVRETDTVCRFGGDEFVVMLSELDTGKKSSIKETGIVAEKIRSIIEKPFSLTVTAKDSTVMEYEHRCTASIGVMMFADHIYSAEDIIKQADIQMYKAKESGRNQISFFEV